MTKKLMKSQNNRVLTGTLGGIAEYFGIDATTARIIYVFTSIFLVGAPILLYVLLAILVPSAERRTQVYEQAQSDQPKQAEPVAEGSWSDF
ncbi:PspC domain-containing protein [Enterococcus sp. DIV0800]|uniref:PspC domain-containing protein n=1 Tax=unclassified Enterococcus TaxID=2608891 RepID=UPI003D300296